MHQSTLRPTRSQLLTWCGDRAPLLAAVAFFLAMFWPFMRKGEQGEWRRCFLRAAHRLEARQILHWPDEVNAYAYPPAMAMLAVPLAKLPFRGSLVGWYLVNVAAMVAVVLCAWRSIGGPSLSSLKRPWSLVFWLGLLLASRFLVAPLENQQFDVVISACLLAGCLALARGHDALAACCLGAGAAMKCTPLLFAPYLVWRGKTRAAAIMLLVAAGINCVPDFLWPRPGGGSYLGEWIGVFLLKVGRSAPGVWDSDLILNQSLAGLINRFAQSGMPLTAAQIPSALAPLTHGTTLLIRGLFYVASATLLAESFCAFGPPGQRLPAEKGDGKLLCEAPFPGAPGCRKKVPVPFFCPEQQLAVETAAIFCLMLLLSPMSSKAHYIVLVLPCLLVAQAVVDGRLNAKLWLPPLFLLGPLTAKGFTGKPLGDLMLAWGLPTWCVLLLLAAMWRLSPGKCFTARVVRCILLPCAWLGRLTTQGVDSDGAAFDERNDDLPLVV